MQTMNTNAQVFYGNSAPSHQNSNNSYPTNQDPRGYVQGVPQQVKNKLKLFMLLLYMKFIIFSIIIRM